VDKTGEICLTHRKIHEHPPFLNGSPLQVADTEWGRLAILICGDLFSDEVKARLPRPVRVVFLPMARSFDQQSPNTGRWEREERPAYLEEVKKLGVLTFLVNSLETPAPEASFGGAMVISPNGELLAESPHGTDEALYFEMSEGE